jgi:hypothetical protein
MAACTLGLYLGVRAFFGLLEGFALPLPRGPWSDAADTAALAAGAGALLGACQALVIGRRLGARRALAWVAATAAGAGFALAVARGGDGALRLAGLGAWFDAVGDEVWRVFAVALFDAALGFGQWLVLRRRLGRSLWWVPSCVAATLATALLPSTFSRELLWPPLWLVLALFGGVTGAVLALLPRGDPGG